MDEGGGAEVFVVLGAGGGVDDVEGAGAAKLWVAGLLDDEE